MKKLIVIAGPTASGKTKLAIDIAGTLNGEIVSADSVQVYKHVNIGAAKPSPEQLSKIQHHLIGVVEPGQPFSVFEYRAYARACIQDIHARGKLALLVGGTGLYIDAVLYDMNFTEAESDARYRSEMLTLENAAPGSLHTLLREKDPSAASRLHPNDIKRLIRALEVFHLTGRPMSGFAEEYKAKPVFDHSMIGLMRDRGMLYKAIDNRVDQMIEDGLIEEVQHLAAAGIDIAGIKAIGYKEILSHLTGDCTLVQAVDQIKTNTRRYAKRQLTWLRKYDQARWFDISDTEQYATVLEEIISFITK